MNCLITEIWYTNKLGLMASDLTSIVWHAELLLCLQNKPKLSILHYWPERSTLVLCVKNTLFQQFCISLRCNFPYLIILSTVLTEKIIFPSTLQKKLYSSIFYIYHSNIIDNTVEYVVVFFLSIWFKWFNKGGFNFICKKKEKKK